MFHNKTEQAAVGRGLQSFHQILCVLQAFFAVNEIRC